MSRKKKIDTRLIVSKPFKMIPDGLWLSQEFNDMKPSSRCIYCIMLAKWDQYHPKLSFYLPYEDIHKITGFSTCTISKSIKELITNGFIEIPERGCYPHNPSLYLLCINKLTTDYTGINRSLPKYLAYLTADRMATSN